MGKGKGKDKYAIRISHDGSNDTYTVTKLIECRTPNDAVVAMRVIDKLLEGPQQEGYTISVHKSTAELICLHGGESCPSIP